MELCDPSGVSRSSHVYSLALSFWSNLETEGDRDLHRLYPKNNSNPSPIAQRFTLSSLLSYILIRWIEPQCGLYFARWCGPTLCCCPSPHPVLLRERLQLSRGVTACFPLFSRALHCQCWVALSTYARPTGYGACCSIWRGENLSLCIRRKISQSRW